MSLHGKLKYEVEYKAPVDKIYEFWSCSISDLPKVSPNVIQNIELVEGCWGKEGCVLNWTCNLDGKAQTAKEIIDTVDDKKKSMSFKVIEGNLLDYYKSFKFILDQVTPKGDGGSLASWSLEYEKLNENVPDPISLRDESINLNKTVAAYLSQAQTEEPHVCHAS